MAPRLPDVRHWGSTPAERAAAYPCDVLVPDADDAYFRAVDVAAPVPTTFRWLCQMKAAPYSYDLIDNLGRRSPRQLTPGLEHLEVGQRIASIFRLTSFRPDESLTMQTRSPAFGHVAMTYVAAPSASDPADTRRSRILVKFLVRYPRGPIGWAMRAVLPAGDLVMMRRQLLNLRDLAQRDAA